MINTQQLGKKIKQLRIKEGYSQEKLAKTLFVSRQSINRWEKGDRLPTMENINMLSEHFHKDFSYFIDDSNLSIDYSEKESLQNITEHTSSFTKKSLYWQDFFLFLLSFSPIIYIWLTPFCWVTSYYSFKHKKRYRLLIFALALSFTSYFLFQLFLFIVGYFGIGSSYTEIIME